MYMREARLKKALNQLRIRLHSVQLTEPLEEADITAVMKKDTEWSGRFGSCPQTVAGAL